MAFAEITCAHCGKKALRRSGDVTRSRKLGWPIYCDKACAGLARRLAAPKTDEQKKAEKAAYDEEYRAKNKAILKAKKASYYARNHDREKEREARKRRMPQHVEYCRTPEYRAWKREYDKEHRAKKQFGEFWECFLLSQDIHEAAVSKAGGWYELALMKGTLNKAIQRRRDYERLDREEPEDGALGNLERGERW
jgi:hypothetical protein